MNSNMNLPERLRAGDSWQLTLGNSCFPASQGWSCNVAIKNKDNRQTFGCTPLGDNFNFFVDTSTTEAITPGGYNYIVVVEKDTQRFTVNEGVLIIEPDLFATGNQDLRSHAQKMLDAIEATLEGRATSDHQEYEIAGRKLQRIPVEELIKARNMYRIELQQAFMAEAYRKGMPGKIGVKFR